MSPQMNESKFDIDDGEADTFVATIAPLEEHAHERVSFSSNINGKIIPTRSHYSEIELASMYMSRYEMNVARRDTREALQRLKSGFPVPADEQEFCKLGLESGIWCPTDHRQKSREAVMREQKTQSAEGFACDQLISMSYTDFTGTAREAAYKEGIAVAREVQQYLGSSGR